MQYLVYENHSKFIKASETIREVSQLGYVLYPRVHEEKRVSNSIKSCLLLKYKGHQTYCCTAVMITLYQVHMQMYFILQKELYRHVS